MSNMQNSTAERRFGIRAPDNGAPVPFRVLISTRWLWATSITGMAALATLCMIPRHLRFPTLLGSSTMGMGVLGAAILQSRRLTVERIELPVLGLSVAFDGFNIVQISDLHMGRPFAVRNLRRAVDWVQHQNPDLLVFTGDFAHYTNAIPLLHTELRGIRARHGVYAVLGNHDYWTSVTALEQALTECGIDLLRNERRCIYVDGASLWLAGIDSVWEARHELQAALDDLPSDAPAIVLAHEPDIADEVASYGIAVQLSGHTHAGHIMLPGLGPLVLPRHGFRYIRGLHRVGPMWLYVSRGLSGIPLRLGCSPEVTSITLRAVPTEEAGNFGF
jgi:uncharacterized protein